MNLFVSAIGTDSGKTLASAIICEALQADYWKPIQCGEPSDRATLKQLVSNPKTTFHQEAYFLKKPASPHDAAEEENVDIDLNYIEEQYKKT